MSQARQRTVKVRELPHPRSNRSLGVINPEEGGNKSGTAAGTDNTDTAAESMNYSGEE